MAARPGTPAQCCSPTAASVCSRHRARAPTPNQPRALPLPFDSGSGHPERRRGVISRQSDSAGLRRGLLTNSLRTALYGATAALVFSSAVWGLQAQQGAPAGAQAQPPGQPDAGQGRGRGRGGRQAGPVEPTPRLADGTVNFGRVPGEKGTWNVPYITNMATRVVGPDGNPLPAMQQAQAAARAGGAGARAGGGGGGGRGGSKSEPWIPWMPWSAAVYDYNSLNE